MEEQVPPNTLCYRCGLTGHRADRCESLTTNYHPAMVDQKTLCITDLGRSKMGTSEVGSSASTHDEKWQKVAELEQQIKTANLRIEQQEELRATTAVQHQQTISAIQTSVRLLEQNNMGLKECYHQLQGEVNKGGLQRQKEE